MLVRDSVHFTEVSGSIFFLVWRCAAAAAVHLLIKYTLMLFSVHGCVIKLVAFKYRTKNRTGINASAHACWGSSSFNLIPDFLKSEFQNFCRIMTNRITACKNIALRTCRNIVLITMWTRTYARLNATILPHCLCESTTCMLILKLPHTPRISCACYLADIF